MMVRFVLIISFSGDNAFEGTEFFRNLLKNVSWLTTKVASSNVTPPCASDHPKDTVQLIIDYKIIFRRDPLEVAHTLWSALNKTKEKYPSLIIRSGEDEVTEEYIHSWINELHSYYAIR